MRAERKREGDQGEGERADTERGRLLVEGMQGERNRVSVTDQVHLYKRTSRRTRVRFVFLRLEWGRWGSNVSSWLLVRLLYPVCSCHRRASHQPIGRIERLRVRWVFRHRESATTPLRLRSARPGRWISRAQDPPPARQRWLCAWSWFVMPWHSLFLIGRSGLIWGPMSFE